VELMPQLETGHGRRRIATAEQNMSGIVPDEPAPRPCGLPETAVSSALQIQCRSRPIRSGRKLMRRAASEQGSLRGTPDHLPDAAARCPSAYSACSSSGIAAAVCSAGVGAV
jgi:hypothetical protein